MNAAGVRSWAGLVRVALIPASVAAMFGSGCQSVLGINDWQPRQTGSETGGAGGIGGTGFGGTSNSGGADASAGANGGSNTGGVTGNGGADASAGGSGGTGGASSGGATGGGGADASAGGGIATGGVGGGCTLCGSGTVGDPFHTASPLADCLAYQRLFGSSATNGYYSIAPQGTAFTDLCDMTDAGGGWTLVDTDYASAMGTATRTYLYLYNGRWYVSPPTSAIWDWSTGQEITGTYGYFDGTSVSGFTCVGSSEKPSYGIGCSNGPGASQKCVLGDCCPSPNPTSGSALTCQDLPNAFGVGACATAEIFARAGTPPCTGPDGGAGDGGTSCAASTPYCSAKSGHCVQCLNNSHCATPGTYCDVKTGSCVGGPSCAGLAANCGPSANESCCASPVVSGGTFYRGYDAVGFLDKSNPATVSDFRLDRFELTVGRFRNFVAAWNGGWRPAAGAGRHTHLNGSKGLRNFELDAGSPYEAGWDVSWAANVAPTNANLACSTAATWTSTASTNENLPLLCENWYEAYAFCIWDGGFLASEAEWMYAQSGGSEQRVYPWSNPPTSTLVDCSYANYAPGGASCFYPPLYTFNVGTDSPKGDGRYGQADLSGNAYEWGLDWEQAALTGACTDCASVPTVAASYRLVRGGSAGHDIPELHSAAREYGPPDLRGTDVGARCARIP